MITIFVKAPPGQKLPKAGFPRTYITDAEPIEVEDCHYYRKALADGDLVELSESDWAAHLAGRDKAEAAAAFAAPVKAAAKSAP